MERAQRAIRCNERPCAPFAAAVAASGESRAQTKAPLAEKGDAMGDGRWFVVRPFMFQTRQKEIPSWLQ